MAWILERYDAERGNTPDNHVNGGGVIGICQGDEVHYNWCNGGQHYGDTLRLLVRYYRTPVAVEQLRLYMLKHGHFILAPRVSLCTGASSQALSRLQRTAWETGTGHVDKGANSYGSIFMHEKNRWWVRDSRNQWVAAADLFKVSA